METPSENNTHPQMFGEIMKSEIFKEIENYDSKKTATESSKP
jgi:hypothetical protein